MSTLDQKDIKQEIVVLIRNSDVFSTTVRGVTTTTEEFDGDNSTTDFTVSQSTIKNVRSVTVGGSAQTFGIDYTVDYSTATISFTSAPASGTDNVDIEYDYGDDKIFGDIPRIDLNLDSYPRLAVQITASRTDDGSLDGTVQFTEYLVTFYAYADSVDDAESYITACREAILGNKKDFYYLRYIRPLGEGATRNADGRHKKIVMKTLECTAPLNEEIN